MENCEQSNSVNDYYSQCRKLGKNIYEIWEEGGAYKDSITPAIYNPDYRNFMGEKIELSIEKDRRKPILSVGSGNATLEKELHEKGYSIAVNDINQDAIEFARKKGLSFILGDIRKLNFSENTFALIYCDGVIGHLYDREQGLQNIFSRLRQWLYKKSGKILISNDSTNDKSDLQSHPRVRGFWWFSEAYLAEELLRAGFNQIESEYFLYTRPLSGCSKRLIITAIV
ncbi:MAG: class I SAM-dependent methyltransferase [Cyanobacteria bacterium SBLK]|nr:class I SAM-dependent methyltransferase [Cyanobacteria bacterium SBLK]